MYNRTSTYNRNLRVIEKKIGSFSVDFLFRAEGKKVTSRAELKFLQLELWLESARLRLINTCLGKFIFQMFE